MTIRTLALTACLVAMNAGQVFARQPATAPAPRTQAPRTPAPSTAPSTPAPSTPAPPAPPRPRKQYQSVNLKIDLSITDQRGGSPAIKRTLSVVVADGAAGSVRTQSEVAGAGNVPLNVDANPELMADGKIRLHIGLQYDWPAPLEGTIGVMPPQAIPRGTVIKTALQDSVTLILDNGKSMVAAQSADPLGDRQVTVEVKATVLK